MSPPRRGRTLEAATTLATALRARVELSTLALLGLLAGAVWGFAELADEVLEGETRAFDRAVVEALRTPGDRADPWGPLWLEETARDVTALGGVAVLTIVVLAAALYLTLAGSRRSALFVVAAVASGMVASFLLKDLFDRPRPDLVPHLTPVATSSFPSGHSMMSALTYLTLGALLARRQAQRRLKLYVLGVAAALALGVGATRIYLGVHYPTDVLAGWTAGAAWAIGSLTLARWLARRGELEPAAGPS